MSRRRKRQRRRRLREVLRRWRPQTKPTDWKGEPAWLT